MHVNIHYMLITAGVVLAGAMLALVVIRRPAVARAIRARRAQVRTDPAMSPVREWPTDRLVRYALSIAVLLALFACIQLLSFRNTAHGLASLFSWYNEIVIYSAAAGIQLVLATSVILALRRPGYAIIALTAMAFSVTGATWAAWERTIGPEIRAEIELDLAARDQAAAALERERSAARVRHVDDLASEVAAGLAETNRHIDAARVYLDALEVERDAEERGGGGRARGTGARHGTFDTAAGSMRPAVERAEHWRERVSEQLSAIRLTLQGTLEAEGTLSEEMYSRLVQELQQVAASSPPAIASARSLPSIPGRLERNVALLDQYVADLRAVPAAALAFPMTLRSQLGRVFVPTEHPPHYLTLPSDDRLNPRDLISFAIDNPLSVGVVMALAGALLLDLIGIGTAFLLRGCAAPTPGGAPHQRVLPRGKRAAPVELRCLTRREHRLAVALASRARRAEITILQQLALRGEVSVENVQLFTAGGIGTVAMLRAHGAITPGEGEGALTCAPEWRAQVAAIVADALAARSEEDGIGCASAEILGRLLETLTLGVEDRRGDLRGASAGRSADAHRSGAEIADAGADEHGGAFVPTPIRVVGRPEEPRADSLHRAAQA